MNAAFSPIGDSAIEWLRSTFFAPYKEGIARWDRFLWGTNFHEVGWPSLTWGERIVSLATAIFLMIPFVNAIIWIAMRVFGTAEILAEPRHFIPVPQIEDDDDDLEAPSLASSPITDKPIRTEECCYRDTKGREWEVSEWTFETYQDRYIVTEKGPGKETISHFDGERNQLSYQKQDGPVFFKIALHHQHGNRVLKGEVRTAEGKQILKKFVLKKDIRWIQQLTSGFYDFVLNPKEQQLVFYTVHPFEYELKEATVTKKGIHQLPPFGSVLKLEAVFNEGITGFVQSWVPAARAYLYFDPNSGRLVKMDFPAGIRERFISELCPKPAAAPP